MTYAINIADLDAVNVPRLPINMAALLLTDFIPAGLPDHVCIDPGRFDTDAIVLNGPAGSDEERCRGLVELLQTVIGPRKLHRRVRCYRQGPKGGWQEIVPPKARRQWTALEDDDAD